MELGKYLVLSTVHVSFQTADLLDNWAQVPATERPLNVASTDYGWFIPTRPVEGDDVRLIPEELPPILAFARGLGCDYVLFDCDVRRISELPEFPW